VHLIHMTLEDASPDSSTRRHRPTAWLADFCAFQLYGHCQLGLAAWEWVHP